MPNKNPQLVLGSQSPRRASLLEQIGLKPDVISAADIDESVKPRELPAPYVLRVASEKNAAIAEKYPNDFIITGDTTVAVGRRILAKAADEKEATGMLNLLSGRAHKVITAVVVRAPNGKVASRVVSTRVKVKRLTAEDIAFLIQSGDWQDAAGAYKIQKNFERFVTHVDGSISGIIGLPLYETASLLRGLGFER